MLRIAASALLIWTLAPLFAFAQLHDGFYDVELRVVPVAGRVHMIQRPDGFANVGVFIGDEGVLLDAVMEARPTAAYDERWGKVPSWSANDFGPIVYHQLGGGSLYDK